MKRKGLFTFGLAGILLSILCAAALAEYRPSARQGKTSQQSDSFRDAVDLERFRKGHEDWDTQALVASGLTALHEEHVQILRELEALRSEIKQLKENRE